MRDQIYEMMMLYGVSVLASAFITSILITIAYYSSL